MTAQIARTDHLTHAEQACADGESALALGDTATAEHHFRHALALVGADSPDDTAEDDAAGCARLAARAWTGVGRVRLARGDVGGAEAEFERARELRPTAAGPLHWLGCAAAHRGDLTTANRHLTASLACAVPHSRSLVQRAYVHARAGNPHAALTDLRAAARTGPLDDEARWILAALSGRSAREVALRMRRAALALLQREREPGPQDGQPGPRGQDPGPRGRDPWLRAGDLVAGAWGVDPRTWGFAPLYAVALVRGGRRGVAVALLGDAVRHDPADHRVNHTLGVALVKSPELAHGSGWERCVAAWAALLHDAGFWEYVLRAAARRYGTPVDPSLVPVLRAGLREALERHMPDDGTAARVAPGPLLQREADAAKLLAAVGGFPSAGGGGAPLFCGPLRIAELGRSTEFGAFAAGREVEVEVGSEGPASPTSPASPAGPTGSTGPAGSSYPSLTYAFSELGFAQLLLGQDKAVDALAALSELRCPGCRARGGPGAAAVCEPGCARFDELNPGYAGLPDKHRRLSLDARGLALEARLRMGRAELTRARPDFASAAACWRRALVHSRELDRYRETQTAVVDMALGAARAAHRAGRLSLAVDTLDMARSVIGANERGRLEGQLARVLADRGISVANDRDALLDQPAADLRRSVAFNPHLLRAQVSLGVVLRGLALARWSSGSLSGARATLREAIDQLTAALAHFPDDPDLEQQREAAVADLDHVMWQPDESEQ
ncbi:tetratricopeptide repeat protein [Streptomyces sp. NPDC029674]|uniref:tetratricopeptide repeat protein n=1 Tax=Streptomyces sp. NPDC029674 TaxID=3365297 RepID=UPI00384EF328